ncbi:helix-turn-helix domain-containing protein [Asaia sp. HN010]|uniref:helix-turn-helix domain-containing protein n=1 Tax=Asaia sp. HN010 TaxID=3081233 RepID=UPI00301A997E
MISAACANKISMRISDLIRSYRKEKGLSQRELAEALGINKSAVAQWELGNTEPSHKNMLNVRSILGISDVIAPSGTRPYSGEFIEDPDELALIHFWRSLDLAKRSAVIDLLHIGKVRT